MESRRNGPLFPRNLAYLWGSFCDLFAILFQTKNIDLAQKGGVLRADSHMVNIDSGVARLCPALPGFARLCPALPGSARLCPALPGFARSGDPGRPGSKPFPRAPEFRKALVGKAQLPQTSIAYSSSVDHIKT